MPKYYGIRLCSDCATKFEARAPNHSRCAACKKLAKRRATRRALQRWRERNPEAKREEVRRYRSENRDKVRRFMRRNENRRYHENQNYRIGKLLRARLHKVLKRDTGTALRELGCSVTELRIHLESQFQPGMSWSNQGEWHIDHVRPLASFDLTDPKQLCEACHYTNLQPLWATQNRVKSCRYVTGEQ